MYAEFLIEINYSIWWCGTEEIDENFQMCAKQIDYNRRTW